MTNTRRVAVLSLALRRIRVRRGCERYTRGACRFEPHLRPTAKHMADRWCPSCIASDALDKAKA